MTSSSHGPSRSASLNCSHLSTLLKSQNQQILETYALACSLARTPLPHTGVQCQTCSRVDRILVCLCCGYTGCNDHIKSHCQEPSNHLLSTDITTAECPIFCAKCCDYCSNTVLLRRSNIQLNTSDAATPGYQASTGLRGIYNMGATCFISVILQVLVHNPLIRNFYLAGGHDRMECTQKASCLACCLDGLFTDFYSSNSVQGYGISSFLMASFNARKTFSGASEQDAHEFLQFLLDELHKSHFLSATFSKIKNTSPSADDEITSCDCVSHRCFNGKLESRIKCDDCGYVTSTIDPMLDLSLGIKTFSSKSSISLSECLDRFTSPEKLDVPFFCKQCAFRKPVKKRLCVKRLPAVLCLQLKVSCILLKKFESLVLTSALSMQECRRKLRHMLIILCFWT